MATTTVREIYHQIEALSTPRDMTDEEFDKISLLQDQISDIENPGYEMVSWFETVNYVNDHLMFTVFSKADGVPVDSIKIPCRGNSFKIRGFFGKSFQEAKDYASQIMNKWLDE